MSNLTQSIKFKIVLAFGLCVVLLIANGGFGVFGLSHLSSNMRTLYTDNTTPIAQLGNIRFHQAHLRFLILQARHAGVDPAQAARLANDIRDTQATVDKEWATYYPGGISNQAERELADQIYQSLVGIGSLVAATLSALDDKDFEQATVLADALLPETEASVTMLSKDADLNLALAGQFADDGEALAATLKWVAIGLIAAGIVFAIFAVMSLINAITKPLLRALGLANNIAEGRLENNITVENRDEFGQLLNELKEMDEHLSSIVRDIKVSAESVTVAAREIVSGNQDLSARTEQQAASLEETAASMTELTETVKQNAGNARQANAMARKASDTVNAGDEAVHALVDTVDKLSASSSKISEITGLIEGIAFQTNILALNAAVEAARAGEQGRGFAVVASEVRTLAQRSSGAAKEIKLLIDSSVSMSQEGSRQAAAVTASMSEVKQGIEQVSHIVGEIATASEEQSQGIEQINQAVAQMDDVTQQNAALVEQAAAAAQALEEQAVNLKSSVAVFKVSEQRGHSSYINNSRKEPGSAGLVLGHGD